MAGVGITELGLAPSAHDLSSLRGTETVSVLRLAQRQKNAADAVRLAAVVEVGVRGFDSGDTVERMPAPDRWSGHEIRAGLAISAYAANDLLDFARTVVCRFPQLWAAMACGDLDESRARVIARWVKDLTDANGAVVVDDVLGRCSIDDERPYTPEALSARCKKLGIALDPDWALRAFQEALKRRRVSGWLNEDGTANLAAQNQDPARVAGSRSRVKRLAAAARRTGDPRTMDELESELFLGLLDGTYASADDDTVLRTLATTRPQDDPTDGHADDGCSGDHSDLIAAPTLIAEPDPADAVPVQDRAQLTVKLSTLLGLDRHPADLAGWGPVHAEYARELVERLSAGQWRYVVLDADMDHTRDHARGGDTVEENLAPACGPDHALKTKGGWRLRRLDERTFRWTTRLGRTYDVAIAPLLEDLPPPGRAPERPAPRPAPGEPTH